METIKVSIITPSYNSVNYIKSAIDSVYNQTYNEFEMIIVDDCSSDGSAEYISSILPDNRFSLIKLKENVGAAQARNIALNFAKGRYVAFLDSDDIWYPEKLEKQIAFMQCNNIAFCFSSYSLMNDSGKELSKIIRSVECISFYQYMKNTVIGCLTVVIDRELVKPFKMPNLRSSHDMALWGDIMRDNEICAFGLFEPLAGYRVAANSNTSNKFRAAMDVWRVYRDYYNINLFRSSWFFLNYVFNAILKRL